MFLFSALNVLVKWQSAHYPIIELVFFRSIFALVPCLLLVRAAGGPGVLVTRHPWSHLFRSGIWLGSVACTFASYHLLPLADAVALSFSAPLFVTALSMPILGERVGAHRWAAVILGFLGVLVIVRPGGDVLQWGSAFAIGNALLFAIGSLSVRQLSRTERSVTIVFYTMALATIATGLWMPFGGVLPEPADWVPLAGLGLAGGIGQFWMTQAYRFAPAAAVMPFTYGAMPWALLFGYAIWGDRPTATVILGASIVIASGLYIFRREAIRSSTKPTR